MKGTEVLLGNVSGREAAARIEDGVLQDLLVDSTAPRPGAIYRAKATRPVKGQGGMFFDTSDGSAYLRGAKGLAPGDLRFVQVSGYADAGKAIPVTDRILFKSKYAIATPGAPGINISRSLKDEERRVQLRAVADLFADGLEETGLIIRSAAGVCDLQDLEDDIAETLTLASAVMSDDGTSVEKLLEGPGPHDVAWRDWACDQTRDGDLAEYAAAAQDTLFRLPHGASISVEPTRALIAVDVNTGADTSPAAGLKANLAAARELPRLLRIKGLGGQIVIDFAPSPKKDRKAIETTLRTAFRADDVETALVNWTQMGHFELNRKRARPPLHEVMV